MVETHEQREGNPSRRPKIRALEMYMRREDQLMRMRKRSEERREESEGGERTVVHEEVAQRDLLGFLLGSCKTKAIRLEPQEGGASDGVLDAPILYSLSREEELVGGQTSDPFFFSPDFGLSSPSRPHPPFPSFLLLLSELNHHTESCHRYTSPLPLLSLYHLPGLKSSLTLPSHDASLPHAPPFRAHPPSHSYPF